MPISRFSAKTHRYIVLVYCDIPFSQRGGETHNKHTSNCLSKLKCRARRDRNRGRETFFAKICWWWEGQADFLIFFRMKNAVIKNAENLFFLCLFCSYYFLSHTTNTRALSFHNRHSSLLSQPFHLFFFLFSLDNNVKNSAYVRRIQALYFTALLLFRQIWVSLCSLYQCIQVAP